jgi:signal transduction histidine kinase
LAQQREAADRERRFAAEAAHVLRNPLATVLLNLEYLRERLPEGSEEARAAGDAHLEGERLLRLTESLLRLARGESVPEGASPLDFGAVVREAAQVAAQGHGRQPAEIDVAQGVRVAGDRAALFGMVEGVVDNAFKYSAPGKPVRVALIADRGLVRLTVEDRGQGIPPQHLPHVFDRFYRGSGGSEGSGLGLAIARAVALAHGGQIHIASEAGSFTRVTIELPEER